MASFLNTHFVMLAFREKVSTDELFIERNTSAIELFPHSCFLILDIS